MVMRRQRREGAACGEFSFHGESQVAVVGRAGTMDRSSARYQVTQSFITETEGDDERQTAWSDGGDAVRPIAGR